MEQQDLLTDEIIDQPLSARFKDNLRGAAIWARICGIFSFASAAFSLFQNLTSGNFLGGLIGATINVIVAIFLFNFGNQSKAGIDTTNQPQLEDGLNSLRRYFKTLVILLIIVFCIILIAGIVLAFGTQRSYTGY